MAKGVELTRVMELYVNYGGITCIMKYTNIL